MAGPAVSAQLNRDIAPDRRGFAFGGQQSGAPLGAFLAGLALPGVAIPFGWRWAFVGAAALALGSAALAPSDREPVVARGRSRRKDEGWGAPHALAVAATLASAAGVGVVSFLVVFSVDSGMSEGSAGLLLGAVSLVATICRIGIGAVADKARSSVLRVVVVMLFLSVTGYLLLTASEPAPIVIGALIVGGLGWTWPGALTLAVVRMRSGAPAWAVGVMMAGLFSGAFGGPLMVGLLAERDAFAIAWIVCACFALSAAATLLAVDRRRTGPP